MPTDALPATVELLGVPIHPVSRSQLIDTLVRWGQGSASRRISYLNVHGLNLACEDADFKATIMSSDLVFCDGYGIKWGARMLGKELPERLTPPDWIPEFLSRAASTGQSVYFLGDEPGVAAAAKENLALESPGEWAAGAHHGYFEKTGPENDAVIEQINASGATHLLVGLGMPLQEKWLAANAKRLTPRVLLPVGAAFRWLAGVETRAPQWMTDHGLEWATRLASHPSRHFRRYVVGNAKFGLRLAGAAARRLPSDTHHGPAPAENSVNNSSRRSPHGTQNLAELPECPACSASFSACVTKTCLKRGVCYGNTVDFLVCGGCGLIIAPDNGCSYDVDDDPVSTNAYARDKPGRIGTRSHTGREYQMASMAVDILNRSGKPPKNLLVFGPGVSLDHVWIKRKFPGLDVRLCDLEKNQSVDNYVDADSSEKFDVVIACEVVEHFGDLVGDFSNLVSKVSAGGLIVMSTEINDSSGELSSTMYPFVPGHTVYYSGRSLTSLARKMNPSVKVDFRLPLGALAQLGSRKRYVLMYRDDSVASGVAEYFAEHLMAPSETITPANLPRAVARWIRYYSHERLRRS